jgi:hypothetical protein
MIATMRWWMHGPGSSMDAIADDLEETPQSLTRKWSFEKQLNG